MNRFAAIAVVVLMIATALPVGSTDTPKISSAAAKEASSVDVDRLPEPVQKQIQAEIGEDAILAVKQAPAKGPEIYVIIWTAARVTIQTTFSAAGDVLERTVTVSGQTVAAKDEEDDSEIEEEQFEREITIDLVPEPAKTTILNEAGSHELNEVEIVIIDGRLLYDADWITDGFEVGIQVAPDGEIVEREREELKEEDDSDD
jgi:hypothetical protein